MLKLIETHPLGKSVIYVNPLYIMTMVPSFDGSATIIKLTNEESLTIEGKAEGHAITVTRALRDRD